MGRSKKRKKNTYIPSAPMGMYYLGGIEEEEHEEE